MTNAYDGVSTARSPMAESTVVSASVTRWTATASPPPPPPPPARFPTAPPPDGCS